MIRNYFKSSIRAFTKNKLYAVISLLGLSVALASTIIIYSFITSELSMDEMLSEKEDTYFVSMIQQSPNSKREVGLTSLDVGNWLSSQSQVTDVLSYRAMGSHLLTTNEKKIKSYAALTQQDFFSYFPLKLEIGDVNQALEEPNSIVLSKKVAESLFPGKNPIGQFLTIKSEEDFKMKVTGVLKSDYRIHLTFDCLVSFDTKSVQGSKFKEWYSGSMYNYVKSTSNSEELASNLSESYVKEFSEESIAFRTYSLDDFYFNTSHIEFMIGYKKGNKENLYILSIIAFLVLIIGLVNYVNINVSLVLKRQREIGIRKVMGATQRNLRSQFYIDAVCMIGLSTLVAITLADLVALLLPELFGSSSFSRPLTSPGTYIFAGIITVVLTLLAGSYPAFVISKIDLSVILKNGIATSRDKLNLRPILIGLQFIISLGLLIMSLAVYYQYQYMTNKDLGFDREQILILPIGESKKIIESHEAVLRDIRSLPEVQSVSVSTDALGNGYTNNSYYAARIESNDVEKEGVMTTYFGIDTAFVNTFGLELQEGRNLKSGIRSDSLSVIINERLADQLALRDPIGSKLLLYGKTGPEMTVVGVVRDFNFQSLKKEINPSAMYLTGRNLWNISIKFQTEDIARFQKDLQNIWISYEQEIPYEYAFLDQTLDKFYRQELRFNKIVSAFTLISVVLSIVGLFGVVSYMVNQRRKEISIRKTLGASSEELLIFFNKLYLRIFAISIAIALPACIYLVNVWLENFAYRIGNLWHIYASATAILLLLIVATISFTSLKAAQSNPVKYLRSE